MEALAVFIGAGIGGLLRYGVGLVVPAVGGGKFPLATLLINVVGSAILAGLSAWFMSKDENTRWLVLLLTTGFTGGFTTFSTFSVETLRLLHEGNWRVASLYVVLSLVLSLAAAAGTWATVTRLSAA